MYKIKTKDGKKFEITHEIIKYEFFEKCFGVANMLESTSNVVYMDYDEDILKYGFQYLKIQDYGVSKVVDAIFLIKVYELFDFLCLEEKQNILTDIMWRYNNKDFNNICKFIDKYKLMRYCHFIHKINSNLKYKKIPLADDESIEILFDELKYLKQFFGNLGVYYTSGKDSYTDMILLLMILCQKRGDMDNFQRAKSYLVKSIDMTNITLKNHIHDYFDHDDLIINDDLNIEYYGIMENQGLCEIKNLQYKH